MAFASFRRQVEQLVRALEARGRPFSWSSQAAVTVSLLTNPLTLEAFKSLTDLPSELRLAGEEPLSLTQARAMFKSSLLDTLVSILSRVEWEDFSSQLDGLHMHGTGFTALGSALSCVCQLLHAWHRVQPPSDAQTAALESFNRYNCSACERSAHSPSWVRHVTSCCCAVSGSRARCL